MTTDVNQLIMTWQVAQKALTLAKETEMTLRLDVIKAVFPQLKLKTNTHELGHGYQLKAVGKQNFKLSGESEVNEALADIEKYCGTDYTFAIKFKPDISETEYAALMNKAATGDVRARHAVNSIASVLTITPGTPSLELVEPKPVKPTQPVDDGWKAPGQ